VLAAALADPYYEARAEACRAITALDRHLSDQGRARVIAGLIRLLGDRWLEVAAAAAEALGHVGGDADARPALLALVDHKYWLVRAAGLRACTPSSNGPGGRPRHARTGRARVRADRHRLQAGVHDPDVVRPAHPGHRHEEERGVIHLIGHLLEGGYRAWSFLRLLDYLSVRAIGAALFAFVSCSSRCPLMWYLHRRGLVDQMRETGVRRRSTRLARRRWAAR